MNFSNLSTSDLTLYHFQACPYCARVRAAIDALDLNIELRDIRKHPDYRDELIARGGKSQVPCLRIRGEDQRFFWLYESQDIIKFLQHFAAQTNRPQAA